MKTRLLSLLAILFMGFTFVNCSSDDDKDDDDETFTQHDDWDKSLEGGTWEINVKSTSGAILATRRYTFFEGGTYSWCTKNDRGVFDDYEDGTFKYDKNSITLDGEQADIVTFTSNTLKFTLNGYIYHGTRIVNKDKKLVESNKQLLTGTWSCIIPTYYANDKSVLTLKPNGEYENAYLDHYDTPYKGNYYVSEDKIFFEEPEGKDPIGGLHQIEKLTSKGFVISSCYADDELGEIQGTSITSKKLVLKSEDEDGEWIETYTRQ